MAKYPQTCMFFPNKNFLVFIYSCLIIFDTALTSVILRDITPVPYSSKLSPYTIHLLRYYKSFFSLLSNIGQKFPD